jgi:hypothetical protein
MSGRERSLLLGEPALRVDLIIASLVAFLMIFSWAADFYTALGGWLVLIVVMSIFMSVFKRRGTSRQAGQAAIISVKKEMGPIGQLLGRI